MTSPNQVGLIKRHPSLTRAQFSHYWLHTHAATGLPWALAAGCITYVQIHNPRLSTTSASPPTDLDITQYDGAAELVLNPPPGFMESAKARDFFKKVVAPDEMKFMVDEARKHARFVEKRLVEGDRFVIVEGGKVVIGGDGRPVVDMAEAMRVWDEWVVEEEGEEEEGK
jgi:hypothetical protein